MMTPLSQSQPVEPVAKTLPAEGIKLINPDSFYTPIKVANGQEMPWWRQSKYYQTHPASETEEDAEGSSVESELTDTETGYNSDDETDVVPQSETDVDDTTSEFSVAPFSWSGAGKEKRRVPLADLPVNIRFPFFILRKSPRGLKTVSLKFHLLTGVALMHNFEVAADISGDFSWACLGQVKIGTDCLVGDD
jgi:hypothetical protein